MFDLVSLGKKAKTAAAALNKLTDDKRNKTLLKAAELLRKNADYLIKENAADIQLATEKGMNAAFIDRLTLNEKVIEGMAVGFEQVAELESPLGKTVYSYDNKEQ